MTLRFAVALSALLLASCASLNPFSSDNPLPALPTLKAPVTLSQGWHESLSIDAHVPLVPALAGKALFVAQSDGRLARVDPVSGKTVWKIETKQRLSGGVGYGAGLVLVGTDKGQVLAFDVNGRPAWTAQIGGEVLAPPTGANGVIVVRAGDAQLFGLDAVTGNRLWIYQRTSPALTLRSSGGAIVVNNVAVAGFSGGKLVGIDLKAGGLTWEATVALPRGTTELERVTDIASQPVTDGGAVCAGAYQGRVACFDVTSGQIAWARDIPSAESLAIDEETLYVTDDNGVVHALNRASGSGLWRQDKLQGRGLTGPVALGRWIAVGDAEGYVHLLASDTGALIGRMVTDGSPIVASPLDADKNLLVLTRKGGLYAFRLP